MESQMYFQEPTNNEDEKTPSPAYMCAACSKERRNSKRERHIPLHPSSSSAAKRHGYTSLPLPPTSLSTPPPVRVGSSATWGMCKSVSAPESDLIAAIDLTGESPNSKIKCSATRDLYKSVSAQESDLTAATDQIGESPNTKRLKRMKERMKEMSKWCDEVIAEDEEGDFDDEGEDHILAAEVVNKHAATKDDEKEDRESEGEEAVSVERNGDCLIIHMKCPCSKAYQFLLSGNNNNNNCYYKLV